MVTFESIGRVYRTAKENKAPEDALDFMIEAAIEKLKGLTELKKCDCYERLRPRCKRDLTTSSS